MPWSATVKTRGKKAILLVEVVVRDLERLRGSLLVMTLYEGMKSWCQLKKESQSSREGCHRFIVGRARPACHLGDILND